MDFSKPSARPLGNDIREKTSDKKMPRLTHCCCFSTETGARILAILQIIYASLFAMTDILLLACYFPTINEMFKNTIFKNTIAYILGVSLASSMFDIIVAGFMLHGVNRKKHSCLLPWLIVEMINLVILTLIGLWVTIIFFNVSAGAGFISLVIEVPILALFYYFWFVVQSVYADIKEQQEDMINMVQVGKF